MANKITPEMQAIFDNISPRDRMYAEYRSRGHSKADAAKRSGSSVKNRQQLSCIGNTLEKKPGVADYIEYLKSVRAGIKVMDDTTVLNMIKEIYDRCMLEGKYKEACKAAEMLAEASGLFDRMKQVSKDAASVEDDATPFSDTEDIADEDSLKTKIAHLHLMLQKK